jgi:beta-lactamase superfamily II metal-dependent hydrolase
LATPATHADAAGESTVPAEAREARLIVKLIAVGHGDAILLTWVPPEGRPANILIDGGPLSEAGRRLLDGLSSLDGDAIDLLVLTHTDADHVGGLLQYARRQDRLRIAEYWGPCLPAFRRFEWLFPERVRGGLDKAEQLESALDPDTRRLYPVEGYSWRSADGALTIRVVSPAARLVERLLVADDAVDLFLAYPTPLGWLLDPADSPPVEDPHAGVRDALRSGFLDPSTAQPASTAGAVGRDRAESIRASSADPEFFGNNVLNDTSIVLLVEARIGRSVKRLLFTGDLENFSYLAARHPLGLQCDIVKAPHHGSWSYLEKGGQALDEVWQWLRPKAVLVSAKGKHGLPRTQFRDAVLRWGATLFCTCRRSREILIGAQADGSCYERFACRQGPDDSVTLTVTETEMTSDGVACGSGTVAGVVPIIQVRQHVIDPSAILDRFTDRELNDHVDWLCGTLRELHRERSQVPADHEPGIGAITSRMLCQLAVADPDKKRFPVPPNIDLILDRAAARGRIWASSRRQYREGERVSYPLPASDDWKRLLAWIDGYAALQLSIPEMKKVPETVPELLAAADTQFLAARLASKFGFPTDMFEAALWPRLAAHLRQKRGFSIKREREILVLHPRGSREEAFRSIRQNLPTTLFEFGKSLHDDKWYSDLSRRTVIWPAELSDALAPPWELGNAEVADLVAMFTGRYEKDVRHWLPADFDDRYGIRVKNGDEVAALLAAWPLMEAVPLTESSRISRYP